MERFVAHLDGGQETPPHPVVGTGFGLVKLSADETMITVDLRWLHLSGGAMAAHIHFGPPGTPGPVVFPLTGVPPATKGHIPEQSFAINSAQVAQLEAGMLYFNIHTPAFPGGEIRGQITAVR
jgi:hypothetical protein